MRMQLRSSCPSLCTLLLAFGCDPASFESEEAPPDELADGVRGALISYEDYKQAYCHEEADGSWVVEGDIRLADEAAVRAYYDRVILGEPAAECAPGEVCPRSTLRTVNGKDNVWTVADKLAITYCFGDLGSSTNLSRVKAAIEIAARDWESTADVNFVYRSELDGTGCAPTSDYDVVFRVRREASCPENRLASAFFPYENVSERELLYCDLGLGKSNSELAGITRHELGHILGFEHEHYRFSQSEDRCTPPSSNMRSVTTADSYSIMGYYFCDGIDASDNDRGLSIADRQGAWSLYNIAKGHGRLAGPLFNQANSFLGTGLTDDLFWYTPGASQYQLWSANTSTSTITFTKQTFTTAAQETYWRPLAVQWKDGSDANFDRELVFYGPGSSVSDSLWVNNSNGQFTPHALSTSGFYTPLLGKFHGDYTEIVWQNVLTGTSNLWQTDGNLNVTGSVATTSFYDTPAEPLSFGLKALTGTFGNTLAGSEILWFGGCYGYISRDDGDGGFETKMIDLLGIFGSCNSDVLPLLGDFNGDTHGDIFWYGVGDGPDGLWLLDDYLWDGIEHFNTIVPHEIINSYKPIVGDYNGDGKSDIFWYRPGTGADPLWLFNSQGGHTSVTRTVNGDYTPIAGHFNNDNCTDVLWYDPTTDELLVWRSNCDGSFTAQASHAVPSRSYPVGYGIGY